MLEKILEKLTLDYFLLEPHFNIDIRFTSTLLPILVHITGSRASDMVEHEHPVYTYLLPTFLVIWTSNFLIVGSR